MVISAIDGMAGIGKTALAVHAAHRLAEQFPDGQLFLDLHGYTQGLPPRDRGRGAGLAAARPGRAAGADPGRTREQAAALYRQRLAGTRTLIVLDNAATEAQVRPLLPGAGSLPGPGHQPQAAQGPGRRPHRVAGPAPAAGRGRAAARGGRTRPDPGRTTRLLDEIAALCGYLPLALRIAASLLRHRPAWTLEHLAGQLRDQHQRVERAVGRGARPGRRVRPLLREPGPTGTGTCCAASG